ncbi:MAG: hypothetical protein Fur005_44110 [Roseiflexaceae bacterium]
MASSAAPPTPPCGTDAPFQINEKCYATKKAQRSINFTVPTGLRYCTPVRQTAIDAIEVFSHLLRTIAGCRARI